MWIICCSVAVIAEIWKVVIHLGTEFGRIEKFLINIGEQVSAFIRKKEIIMQNLKDGNVLNIKTSNLG